jgi:hypothetical protein
MHVAHAETMKFGFAFMADLVFSNVPVGWMAHILEV